MIARPTLTRVLGASRWLLLFTAASSMRMSTRVDAQRHGPTETTSSQANRAVKTGVFRNGSSTIPLHANPAAFSSEINVGSEV